MNVWNRICIKDYDVVAENGDHFMIRRGKEYVTSAEREDHTVVVFTNFWHPAPISHFGGELPLGKHS